MDPLHEEFRRLTSHIPYKPKSIFPSEMFLFYSEVVKHRCDHILESGVGYGGSTTYLAVLFPKVRITSIDKDGYGQLSTLKAKLRRSAKNIEVLKGNSVRLLPKIIKSSDAKSIAVLIDGPKREKAVHLAQALLKQDARVKFVAVHDLPKPLELLGQAWTRTPPYQKHYGYLDEKVGGFREFYPMGPGLTLFTDA